MKPPQGSPETPQQASAGKCPNCGKPTDPAHRPFCSKRCRQVDLNRWLSGAYVIPGRSERGPSGDEDEDPS